MCVTSVNKLFYFVVRLILGVIFIFAGVEKILHPADFAEIIYNYRILPETYVNFTAIILPWLEVLLGFMLIFGIWMPATVIISNFLLVAFLTALVFNMLRGLDVNCGCFSTSDKTHSDMIWYIFRDFIFLVLGGYLFFRVMLTK